MLDEQPLRDDASRVIGCRGLDQIQLTLASVMLRRRKAEVLTQLPERGDSRLFVPLKPQRRLHYDENGAIVTRIVARRRALGLDRLIVGRRPASPAVRAAEHAHGLKQHFPARP